MLLLKDTHKVSSFHAESKEFQNVVHGMQAILDKRDVTKCHFYISN